MTGKRGSRQPMKQIALERFIRGRIVSGALAAGARLPTREELRRKHRVSVTTVQRALDRLIATRFVEPRGTLGTFVTDLPPHQHRYAMVFFSHPTRNVWTRFQQVLTDHVSVLKVRGVAEIVPIYCVDGPSGEDHARLVADVRDQQYAGIFFPFPPWPIKGSPLFDKRFAIPCVTLANTVEQPGFGLIELDGTSFVRRACAWFRERKRQRLAVVCGSPNMPTEGQLLPAARDHGLTLDIWNIQRLSPDWAPSARALGHLLMRGAREDRPDALFITDDNLVESTIAGVLDAGLHLGSDIDIVGHANFPIATPVGLPVRRLGFDADEILMSAIALMDDMRRRAGSTPTRVLAARFLEEAVSMRADADARPRAVPFTEVTPVETAAKMPRGYHRRHAGTGKGRV